MHMMELFSPHSRTQPTHTTPHHVCMQADSRTSTGSYIANRVTDKITPLADNVYILRSGSAADTQAIASYVQLYIAQHQAEANERIKVKVAANMAMQMAYSNKEMLQVGQGVAFGRSPLKS